ncbi:hypothetical protein FB556_0180 [Enteractinococcus coprophilus]|uniref:Uncharacterized protein n=2 Tax=Enteractinococcus coprophilus TaxID=1027633 RepID=A0A543AMI2_9MICC|nr:hypothetical protein FB556_0180 [Enteractinococcus coprophilus]
MNFLARLGVGLITGLVSYGLVPAAYAVATPMTHPNGVTTSAASQTVSPSPPVDTAARSLAMSCQVDVTSTQLTIDFSPEPPFDELTVKVNGQLVDPQTIHDSSIVIERPDSGSTVGIELWQNASLTGECIETAPSTTAEPTPPEPTPTETIEPTTPSSPTEPETTPTSGRPTPGPSQTSPGLTPTPTAPSKPTVTAPGSSSAAPSRPASSPPMSTTPSLLPSGTTQQQESTTQRRPSGQIGPRIIRQFSHDPRHLLPQLLGIDVQPGSGLIMLQPRSADQGPPDLETLPPVSEEELEAIKARLSSPDRADRPPADHLASADERISNRTSNALVPSLIAALCLGLAIFWLLKRRRHNL